MGKEGGGRWGKLGGDRKIFGMGVIPKFVVFY